jgi:hypothetical protein
MICDVRDLPLNQPRIDCMPNCSKAGDAMLNLEVPIVVPCKRGNSVTLPNTSALQGISQLARTPRRVLIGISMNRTLDGPRHNLSVAMKPISVLQKP